MAKYRKLPVEIEAELYQSGLEDGYKTFDKGSPDPLERPMFMSKSEYERQTFKPHIIAPCIKTLKGWIEITEGDYIITGIKGERYPCKPDIFEQTYELA